MLMPVATMLITVPIVPIEVTDEAVDEAGVVTPLMTYFLKDVVLGAPVRLKDVGALYFWAFYGLIVLLLCTDGL